MTGTCVWFSGPKGYGFVRDSSTGKEYFCHHSSLKMEGYRVLKQDQAVDFQIEQGPHGTQCADVKILE